MSLFEYVPIVYLALVAIPLIVIDIREHRLPNKLVIPAIPLTLVLWVIVASIEGKWGNLFIALGIGLLTFGLGLGANRLLELGMGDVKLFTAMALVLGWFMGGTALLLPVIATAIAIGYGFLMFRLGKLRAGSAIAFGPHIYAGFAILLGIAL